MQNLIPEGPLSPPPGRPSWGSRENLPLLYLGWGRRDYMRDPLVLHFDRGSDYHIILRGEVVITAAGVKHTVSAPAALIFHPRFEFGITQTSRQITEILVWIWHGLPRLRDLRPPQDKFLNLDLKGYSLDSLIELHKRCRSEVSRADVHLPRTLKSLRNLVEVEIFRASRLSPAVNDVRWDLTASWMKNNLPISAPIPALCDYLGMSASTLHRFFVDRCGRPPGAYFRGLRASEARRLIHEEGWQVKAAAYYLGYRHPNDLSRAMRAK